MVENGNFLLFPAVTTFLKSVVISWRYCHEYDGFLFTGTSCICL